MILSILIFLIFTSVLYLFYLDLRCRSNLVTLTCDKCKGSYKRHWDKLSDEPIKNIPFTLQTAVQNSIKAEMDRRKLAKEKGPK